MVVACTALRAQTTRGTRCILLFPSWLVKRSTKVRCREGVMTMIEESARVSPRNHRLPKNLSEQTDLYSERNTGKVLFSPSSLLLSAVLTEKIGIDWNDGKIVNDGFGCWGWSTGTGPGGLSELSHDGIECCTIGRREVTKANSEG